MTIEVDDPRKAEQLANDLKAQGYTVKLYGREVK